MSVKKKKKPQKPHGKEQATGSDLKDDLGFVGALHIYIHIYLWIKWPELSYEEVNKRASILQYA